MRNFKIFLCIFFIFLIQTVILGQVHIFGAVPSAVLAYIICVMIQENEFRNAAVISIICAVLMGALSGRDFIVTTLFYVYSSIIIFALRKKPPYVHNGVKAVVWTFISSAMLEVLFFVIRNLSFDVMMLVENALPTAVFNAALAVVIYPLLKRIMYKEEKKKKLLIG